VIILADQTCALPRRELVALSGRHEVVVVRLGDELLEQGFAGAALPVVDAEGGERGVIWGPGDVKRTSMPPGVDLVELRTDEDYLPAVRAMLERRERRRAH
jgi:hypothetical protein